VQSFKSEALIWYNTKSAPKEIKGCMAKVSNKTNTEKWDSSDLAFNSSALDRIRCVDSS
jgi:hypothetical protein